MAKPRWFTICPGQDEPFETSESESQAKQKAVNAIRNGTMTAWVGKLTAVYTRDVKEDSVTE